MSLIVNRGLVLRVFVNTPNIVGVVEFQHAVVVILVILGGGRHEQVGEFLRPQQIVVP